MVVGGVMRVVVSAVALAGEVAVPAGNHESKLRQVRH